MITVIKPPIHFSQKLLEERKQDQGVFHEARAVPIWYFSKTWLKKFPLTHETSETHQKDVEYMPDQ